MGALKFNYKEEIRRSLKNRPIEAAAAIRNDADAAVFERQVVQVLSENYMREFPDLTMANGDVIPINRSIRPGVMSYEYYVYEPVGFARIMNSYADTDIPKVGVKGSLSTGKVVETATFFGWSVGEMETAQETGFALQSASAEANKRAHQQLWNTVGWFGDESHGIRGLLTHPNITRLLAPFKAGGSVAADRLWANKTFDEVAADFAALVNTSRTTTNGIEQVTDIYLPGGIADALSWRILSTANGSNFTMWNWLEENSRRQGVTIHSDYILNAANHADVPEFVGLNVAVAYNRNASKAELVVPLDYTQYPPQWEKLDYNTYTRSKCGGALVRFPLSIVVMTGI
jgi:hypothetical protein